MAQLKNTKINFVSAEDGKLVFTYTELGVRKEVASEDPNILGRMLAEIGVEDTLMASSSMDFASEYGFKRDGDAKKLFKKAIAVEEQMNILLENATRKAVA